jgi:site-specific DNA recombinase
MFAALGQLERDNIVERTTLGRNQRGKIDGEKGGSVPYGYVRLTGLVVDEDKAEVVREIFDKKDNQNWSMLKIANWLNEQGIKTSRNKKWYAGTVKVVLSNREKYQGGLRGDSNETWPKIL